jgi:ABC-2 type transport system ATP-binding protein
VADFFYALLRGQIVATGSPRELTSTGNGLTTVHATGCNLENISFPNVEKESTQENYRIYYTTETGPMVAAIINAGTLVDLRVERPSLEERFLELTKDV